MINSWARTYGDVSDDYFKGIYVDGDYVYVVGNTESEGQGGLDALIVKFNKADLTIAVRKIYGGAQWDYFEDVYVDGDYVYAVGSAKSEGEGGYDALIVKFNKADLTIAVRKIYGGAQWDHFDGIYVDGDYVYAVGSTKSEGEGDSDALIVKFNKADLTIAERKIYGGATHDVFDDVYIDGEYVYVVGQTNSEGEGDYDALIVKFNKADLTIAERKIYGGGGWDRFTDIYVDGDYVFVVGRTESEGEGGYDALIVKFNKADLTIAERKIYGGDRSEHFYSIYVDGNYVYAVGYTKSEGITIGDYSALIVKFNKADLTIARAKVYGGSDDEYIKGVYVYGSHVYIVGRTESEGEGNYDALIVKFLKSMLSGSFDSYPAGFTYQDSALTLADSGLTLANSALTLDDSALTLAASALTLAASALTLSSLYKTGRPTADFSAEPTTGYAPLTVEFTDLSTNDPTSWSWDFGDGDTSGEENPSHIYDEDGIYTVTLIVTNAYGSDTMIKEDYIIIPPSVRYKLTIGNQIIQCEADKQNLLDCSFTLRKNGGCAEFSLSFGKPLTVNLGDEVKVYLFGSGDPWYRGRILDMDMDGSSSKARAYSGYGHSEQLGAGDLVDTEYGDGFAIEDLRDAVIDILDTDVRPYSALISNDNSKIEDPSYTIIHIKFDKVKPIDALRNLCEMAGGWELGVDEDGDFYFRAESTSVTHRKWVGKHLATYLPKRNMRKVVNMIYLEGGALSAGSNYDTVISDVDSINSYGRRSDKATIPSGMDTAEIQQWGNDLLNEKKDPIISARITGIDIEKTQTKIWPRGLMKITGENGEDSLELPIIAVVYHITPAGITADIELGIKRPSTSDAIQSINRKVKQEREQLASDVEQLAEGTAIIDDAIKDFHIDWGTGADEVSAADIPIADAGDHYTTDDVESALQEIADDRENMLALIYLGL